MSSTRRQILVRGGAVAGAAALPSALRATPALAQTDAETDAIASVVELEQAAKLAYTRAAEKANGEAKALYEQLAGFAAEHATALSEALEQLGTDPPDESSDPASYDALADFDEKADEQEQLDFLTKLEEELIAGYAAADPDIEAPDLVVTAAQVSAAHAQAWVALKLLGGGPPPTAVELPKPDAGDSSADAEPATADE